tara:strand:+ start:52 stop:642 length:591 start_codon:yes stop_codon:yes gene_type:complete
MKYFLILFLSSSIVVGSFPNKRFGGGVDIGSKGSGFFFNYIMGNANESLDIIYELRYFDIKGETELIVIDYYTGQPNTIGKQNLILLPIFMGVNFHPFAGEIANNFSPFLTMRFGGSLAIDGAEDVSGFNNVWSDASTFWSPAGFVGGGIEFRWLNRSSVSLHLGYDILKLTQKADNKDDYSGVLIHIAFNRFFKK